MSVPTFNGWTTNWSKVPNISSKQFGKQFQETVDTIDRGHDVCYLYIDMNHILHVIVGPKKNWKAMDIDTFFHRIIDWINSEIDMLQPRRLYLVFDGVAALAKVNEQRKSSLDVAAFRDEKYVMEEIMDKMSNHFKTNRKDVKVVISSSNAEGEAAHKLMDYIHKEANDGIHHYVLTVDSDMILLALITHNPKITLYSRIKGNKCEVVEISTFRELLQHIFKVDSQRNDHFENVIEDFVFMAVLLANDYLGQVEFAGMPTQERLDYFIWIYNEIFNKGEYLTDHENVNYANFTSFVNRILEEVVDGDNVGTHVIDFDKAKEMVKSFKEDPTWANEDAGRNERSHDILFKNDDGPGPREPSPLTRELRKKKLKLFGSPKIYAEVKEPVLRKQVIQMKLQELEVCFLNKQL